MKLGVLRRSRYCTASGEIFNTKNKARSVSEEMAVNRPPGDCVGKSRTDVTFCFGERVRAVPTLKPNVKEKRLPEWNPTHGRDDLGLLGFPPDPVHRVPLPDPNPTDEQTVCHHEKQNFIIIISPILFTRVRGRAHVARWKNRKTVFACS